MKSPISDGPVRLLKSIARRELEQIYLSKLNFDVRKFIPQHIERIDLYRCDDTGYEFFYPFDLQGSPDFYADLYSRDGSDWGYCDGKWEHDFVFTRCTPDMALLDVGAGDGKFMRRAAQTCASVTGIETSPFGVRACREAGLQIHQHTIGEHAEQFAESYDLVTAFQVLEHVADVREFLRSMSRVCKRGGQIILSVPNNDSFVGMQDNLPLNMPPHHVGRWNRASLEKLPTYANWELLRVDTEPLQKANLEWYVSWLESRYLPENRIVRSLYYRLGLGRHVKRFVTEQAHTILGHTILATFSRRP
jgi:2-polyprenyl-3-methyl-5-hydroxy-6-metoxy-1,4-benzoquinol methylase